MIVTGVAIFLELYGRLNAVAVFTAGGANGARVAEAAQHFSKSSMAITEARTVMAIMAAGNVKSQWLEASGFHILFTDHKPWEEIIHLNNKTLNMLQSAVLEQDFVVQNKKSSHLHADFLLCLLTIFVNPV